MTELTIDELLVPLGAAAMVLIVSFGYARAIRGGQPLTSAIKKGIVYIPIFTLGMGYLMMFAGKLHWKGSSLFLGIAIWGGLVLGLAILGSGRNKQEAAQPKPKIASPRDIAAIVARATLFMLLLGTISYPSKATLALLFCAALVLVWIEVSRRKHKVTT